MIYTPINEQLRSLLDREALGDLTKRYLVTEVLKVLHAGSGGDLNTKTGSGDLNAKLGGGDLNTKLGNADLSTKTGSGDLGPDGQVAAVVELMKAGMAMGRAKAILADLQAVQSRLAGEDRARLQKAINNLETNLAIIEDSSNRYAAALACRPHNAGSNGGRAIHLHLHLEA